MITYSNHFYKILSEKYNLPIEAIRDVVTFFWREGVKRDLESLVNAEIFISKLGSFKIKEYKVNSEIEGVTEVLKREWGENITESLNIYLNGLNKIKNSLEDIRSEKTKFNESIRKAPGDISEQEQDLGGVEE